ncbi:hypothetical protein [Leisingera sp. McT4-56]|uniref:hypothetical protein n=1 Tax=Leisingera sp. McT4-56 TaxID=2881255 RepID=UPI001CF8731B|nr:hypothetical protein [Leisingera sp. McT4-56]MCB4456874.1 hypothetical protein [Leisingera sp. McT4-56]
MTRFCVAQGLHRQRVGNATDGYRGGIRYGVTPVDDDRKVTVRTRHVTNMPSMEIPGGDGMCAELASRAFSHLGPVNVSRIDVCLDCRSDGLYEALSSYLRAEYNRRPSSNAPEEIDGGKGKTIKWNRGEQRVKVYQKDCEQAANGKLIGPPDPHRIRIEFSFYPHKIGDKAGLARLAAAEGPGALLGTARWVRRMVSQIAIMLGVCDKNAAELPITRYERLPIVRSIKDKARWALGSSVRTLCHAAAAQIVEERHGGDWSAADVEPEDIKEGVLRLVEDFLDATEAPYRAASRLGLEKARDIEDQAACDRKKLRRWMDWQEQEEAYARDRLNTVYEVAADGEHRRLNRLRAELQSEHTSYITQRGLNLTPALLALERAYAKQLAPATTGQ